MWKVKLTMQCFRCRCRGKSGVCVCWWGEERLCIALYNVTNVASVELLLLKINMVIYRLLFKF